MKKPSELNLKDPDGQDEVISTSTTTPTTLVLTNQESSSSSVVGIQSKSPILYENDFDL
jgi:hypothetical protein